MRYRANLIAFPRLTSDVAMYYRTDTSYYILIIHVYYSMARNSNI